MSIDKNNSFTKNSEALRILNEIMSEPVGYEDLEQETRDRISKEQFEKMSAEEKEAVIEKDTKEFVESMHKYRFRLSERNLFDDIKNDLDNPKDMQKIQTIKDIFKDFDQYRFKLD